MSRECMHDTELAISLALKTFYMWMKCRDVGKARRRVLPHGSVLNKSYPLKQCSEWVELIVSIGQERHC